MEFDLHVFEDPVVIKTVTSTPGTTTDSTVTWVTPTIDQTTETIYVTWYQDLGSQSATFTANDVAKNPNAYTITANDGPNGPNATFLSHLDFNSATGLLQTNAAFTAANQYLGTYTYTVTADDVLGA